MKYKQNGRVRVVVSDESLLQDATQYQIHPVSFVMDEKTIKQLDKICKSENVGRSTALRALIRSTVSA